MNEQETILELWRLFDEAPDVPGYGGGKWAVYGVGCAWWSSNPTRDLGYKPSGLPGCPHCGSVLMQAPLSKFLEAGMLTPAHYGVGGLESFLKAHHGYTARCDAGAGWAYYFTAPLLTPTEEG